MPFIRLFVLGWLTVYVGLPAELYPRVWESVVFSFHVIVSGYVALPAELIPRLVSRFFSFWMPFIRLFVLGWLTVYVGLPAELIPRLVSRFFSFGCHSFACSFWGGSLYTLGSQLS